MDRGLVTLIGMSIAYVASFAGLAFAYWGWKKHLRSEAHDEEAR
jgi:H+/gluconate symporter-like permease